MQIGKIPGDKLEEIILNKTGYRRDDVLLHAALGEDSAVVDLGDSLLVISSDPITGANNDSGYIAVHVACNDLAAAGAEPVGIQVILLLPEEMKESDIAKLMDEISTTATEINVEVLGGHTEILSSVNKAIICITAVGKAPKNMYVTSSGAVPGNDLIVTKGVGIEGTYILANDHRDMLLENGVPQDIILKAVDFRNKLSVIKEGQIAACLGASAMHDITEGGLYGALDELSKASGVGFCIDQDKVPILNETRIISEVFSIDPLGLISSGSMLITSADGESLVEKLKEEDIFAVKIGNITTGEKSIIHKGEKIAFQWTNKDELWRLME
ncbi:MAG: AIR synthase family protein [Bacillota bacterium]